MDCSNPLQLLTFSTCHRSCYGGNTPYSLSWKKNNELPSPTITMVVVANQRVVNHDHHRQSVVTNLAIGDLVPTIFRRSVMHCWKLQFPFQLARRRRWWWYLFLLPRHEFDLKCKNVKVFIYPRPHRSGGAKMRRRCQSLSTVISVYIEEVLYFTVGQRWNVCRWTSCRSRWVRLRLMQFDDWIQEVISSSFWVAIWGVKLVDVWLEVHVTMCH